MYPTLKSNILSFSDTFFTCVLFFSKVHIECQIEMSRGAGIHPKNAIKNNRPVWSGKICWKELGCSLFKKANVTAAILLMARIIIMTFINLSSQLYLPDINKKEHIRVIIRLQITMLSVIPNSVEAMPAVTTVTALCIVNIVPIFNMK